MSKKHVMAQVVEKL